MKQKSGPGKAPAQSRQSGQARAEQRGEPRSAERARFLQKSNTFLICAALACSAAGDSLDLSCFDRTAACPDWSAIDAQIARFGLERVRAPSVSRAATSPASLKQIWKSRRSG